MKIVELLEEFEKFLDVDDDIKAYCADSLDWITARKSDWDNDKIRVGVIGVTSGGKSTLINALMGMDILSSSVEPSSGQIVCCSYGEEESITIHFEDGRSLVLSGDDFKQDRLMEYSDYRLNPKNEKKVSSIELKAPSFDMGKEIILIDSPGLDAYGMEAEEKITLETLVPTVDVCIYVTTMKANSDRKAIEILNAVARYDCPLIIVQNMADALKTSSRGHKSRTQLADEYYKRIEEVVLKSEVRDKKQVKIVQISAQNAKQFRYEKNHNVELTVTDRQYEESNFDNFIDELKEFLMFQAPKINRQRVDGIVECIIRLNNDIWPYCTEDDEGNDEIFKFDGVEAEIEEFKTSIEEEYRKIAIKFKDDAKELKNKCSDSSFILHIEEYANRVNMLVNNAGLSITELVRKGNEFIEELADRVNIPERDLLKSPRLDFYTDITVEKKKEVIRGKVKDAGFGGIFNRVKGAITGDSRIGYHTEVSETIKTDIDSNRAKMIKRLREAPYKYDEIFLRWYEESLCEAFFKVNEAVESAREAYLFRQNAKLQKDKLIQLGESLALLLEEIPTYEIELNVDISYERKERIVKEELLSEIEFDSDSGKLLRMSRGAMRNQHLQIMKAFIAKENLTEHEPYIVGWDATSIDELLWQTGISDAKVIDLSKDEMPDFRDDKKQCFFILVNAIQYGAAKKQILELGLDGKLGHEDFVFWVVQDLQELINSRNMTEGLEWIVKDLSSAKTFKFKSVVWLVHQNPIYNIAFLEKQYQMQKGSIDNAQQEEIFKELCNKYSVYCDEAAIKIVSEML